jgi:predicted phosphate transport protein (TIGR00153 family)
MPFRLFLPKEFQFFDLFDKQAGFAVEAASLFKDLASSGKFMGDSASRMHEIEHHCDDVTHEIINKLNRTFITPFDREDIHALAHELDTVVDLINTTTSRMRLFKLSKVNKKLVQFSDLIEQSVGALSKAVKCMRDGKQLERVNQYCIEINRLENEGDQLRDESIGDLFAKSKDPIHIIKWKEIFTEAETVLDACEDVANIVESILVKQA